MKQMPYCPSVYKTLRRRSREVSVGGVGIGGENPLRIQSMTTSNTRDVESTVEQIVRLADAGCEIARVTVQGKQEAYACEAIKNSLLKRGYAIPLVADIHFYPPAALIVAEFVEKVRINPGNFADKRASFSFAEYSDQEYAEEIEKLQEKFSPLVLKCKRLGRALRIGTNHGSLSDRIMNRYGDTPRGMVESALEFARICRAHDFHGFLFSMKSSNPHVMVQAYRLLVAEMMQLGWDYPLHLGVTEAGEGEEGRIKSAIGIGSLLLDGLGDTLRVSLTEDPWFEIDPCKKLMALAERARGEGVEPFEESGRSYFEHQRRKASLPSPLHPQGSVALSAHASPPFADAEGGQEADFLLLAGGQEAPQSASIPLVSSKTPQEALLEQFHPQSSQPAPLRIQSEAEWPLIRQLKPPFLLLSPPARGRVQFARKFFNFLFEEGLESAVLLNFSYSSPWEEALIEASAECGSLLCDGLGEGLLLEGPYPAASLKKLSFAILQGCRMRSVKTEFISCPSCGRTLFNLQEVSKRIRGRTGHLPGVKIAIMGCIVNGPGEMADADFGYVGSRAGEVDLYVGKRCVERKIPQEEAEGRLIELIKAHGRWIEPALSS